MTVTRICSLAPGATELIAALGLAERLVAVSAACDWPPEIRALPAAADPAGRVDGALLRRQRPQLVVAPAALAAAAAAATGADVLVVEPRRIVEVEAAAMDLALRLGVPARGPEVVETIQKPIEGVLAAVVDVVRPRVFVAWWLDPLLAAGRWVPEMVSIAGGEAVLAAAGEDARAVSWTDVAAAAPGLVVVAACGGEAGSAAIPEAPPGTRVVEVAARGLFSRPGPRLAHGIVQLAHLLHPDRVADPRLPLRILA